ncbi:MAG TPA: hypothetical protein VFQ53_27340 [Kofleriaceae bacterium]|nr:hypothetical protein [Kofleriaceae bacterium]
MRRAALALVGLAACNGETGTIQLELAAAPGSSLIANIQHLRVTITDPKTVIETDRDENGLNLALDVEATGGAGALIVEGFDGSGALIAGGESPIFPVAAINARIVVYVAAPLSIGPSISTLPAPRTNVAAAALAYGVVIAGGEDEAGAKTDSIFVYNAYDHGLTAGLAMPAKRAAQTLAVGSNDAVYMFGGIDEAGTPTGTFWRFDTTVAPMGAYTDFGDDAGLARASTSAIQLGVDRFVITGAPPLDLTFNAIAARTDLASLSPNGASVIGDNGQAIAMFAGDPIVRLRGDSFDTIPASAEDTATAAGLPDGRIVFAGVGGAADVLVIDAATGSASRVTGALSTPRLRAAVAATSEYLVVAGGTDAAGASLPSADILAVTDLARIATVPCVPRSRAAAFVLPNRQILVVGGTPANDQIELFTPPPASPE